MTRILDTAEIYTFEQRQIGGSGTFSGDCFEPVPLEFEPGPSPWYPYRPKLGTGLKGHWAGQFEASVANTGKEDALLKDLEALMLDRPIVIHLGDGRRGLAYIKSIHRRSDGYSRLSVVAELGGTGPLGPAFPASSKGTVNHA